MAELKSYVCPNCGANTTNAQNCDYCGSLLVRFVERNIDLSGTSYLNNDKVIPGLIKHLEQNLLAQKTERAVITDIYFKQKNGKYNCIGVLPQRCCGWHDDNCNEFNIGGPDDGLVVILSFYDICAAGPDDDDNNFEKLMEQKFIQLPSSNLFTPHTGFYVDGGVKAKYSEHAINFGHDPEGAARIISEIIDDVFGVSFDNTSIEIFTNAGGEAIGNCRAECNRRFYGVDNSEETDDRSNYSEAYDEEDEDSTFSIFGIPWYWLLAAISAFISIISQCS